MTASTQDFNYHTPQVAAHLKLVTADLSDADVEEIGRRFDAIRESIRTDLGEDDAAYIHRIIRVHRALELSARATLMASSSAGLDRWNGDAVCRQDSGEHGTRAQHHAWPVGLDARSRDPLHLTWEWDSAISSDDWKKSHNDMHHMWTNVIGKDKDVGYGRPEGLRTRWKPEHLGQVGLNVLIALFFEYGIAMYDATMEAEKIDAPGHPRLRALKKVWTKVKAPNGQGLSRSRTCPASARQRRSPLTSRRTFCATYEDATRSSFVATSRTTLSTSPKEIEGESQGEWYLRQLMGSANIEGSELFTS